jgi:hypothetical protein
MGHHHLYNILSLMTLITLILGAKHLGQFLFTNNKNYILRVVVETIFFIPIKNLCVVFDIIGSVFREDSNVIHLNYH